MESVMVSQLDIALARIAEEGESAGGGGQAVECATFNAAL